MLPNFIIAGSSTSGTSFLTASIIQHPEIYLPKNMRPEPHYFYKSWEYKKPLYTYEDKYFSEVTSETAIGERSSSYMFGEQVAERMYKHIPNVKLIFMLRNPIERTYANYRYTVLEGLEENSFETALEKEKDRIQSQSGIWAEIQPYNYTGRGLYFEQLERFLNFFPKEQLLFLKSESVNKSPDQAFNTVFSFLNVNTSFTPSPSPTFSSLSVINRKKQTQLRRYFKDKFDLFIEAIRVNDTSVQALFECNEDAVKFKELSQNLKGIKEPMSQKARKYLQNKFKNNNKKLKSILEFDIEDWV